MAIFTALGVSVATGLAAVGAAATVVGVVGQRNAQRDQANISNQAAKVERRRSSLQNIRQAQLARARALVSAEGSGAGGSSGAAGGIGSVGSRLGSAFGTSSQLSNLSTDFNAAGARASTFGALSSIGGKAFGLGANAGGLSFLNPQVTTIQEG